MSKTFKSRKRSNLTKLTVFLDNIRPKNNFFYYFQKKYSIKTKGKKKAQQKYEKIKKMNQHEILYTIKVLNVPLYLIETSKGLNGYG